MLIAFFCPHCQAKLEIEAEAAGTQVACPQCAHQVTIPRKPFGPDTTIGGFRIKKLLARGAMGEVYLARQLSMDRDVAIKILPPGISRDKEAIKSFLHEVRLQAKLEHPNIVTAHEAGEDGGVYFLAMSFVGESLAERLERGPLPEKEALEIVHKLADALAYAWDEHKLLHRDIKPGNIMLDQNDSPRLTDLGLSKSLKHAGGAVGDDVIVGTPNYMSPEQAEGREEIDFRADMYSLGATLYHMVTGKIPFEGEYVDEVLRKQSEEALADPRDFNPNLSAACVELMALMLAKKRDHRHPSWNALVGDIERVLAGEHPSKQPLGPGESALLRVRALGAGHDEHKKIVLRHSQVLKLQQRGPGGAEGAGRMPRALAKLALLMLIVAAIAVVLALRSRQPPEAPPPQAVAAAPAPAAVQAPQPDARLAGLERKFTEGLRYAAEHPDDFEGSIQWFEQVRTQGAGTEFEIRAAGEIRRREAARQASVDDALAKLRDEAERLFGEGKQDPAVALVLDYAGPLAAETLDARKAMAGEFTRRVEEGRRAESERAEAARAKLAELRQGIAEDLLALNFDHAQVRVDGAESDEAFGPVSADLVALKDLVAQVIAMPSVIRNSFVKDQGREIPVGLKTGVLTLQIVSVGPSKIKARRQLETAGYMERSFTVEELSLQEQLERLGTSLTPALDVMRGLVAVQWQKPAAAVKYFRRAGGPLGEELAGTIDRKLASARDAEAAQAFAALLRLAGLAPDAALTGEVVRAVRKTIYSPGDAARIRDTASKFRQSYGDTAKAQEAEALLSALEKVGTLPRTVDPVVLAQAVKRIQELNPQVTSLSSMYDVTDDGVEMDLSKNPELINIQPLRGLPLTKLNLAKTKVSDLEPLSRMPLRFLDLGHCPIRDIGPLEGMPLEELHLRGCRVKNLRPLKGMPLKILIIPGCPIDMVTALSDLPLKQLDLGNCPVDDIRPLRSTPLEWLSLWQTKIPDLKPLKGMGLTWLNAAATRITNLDPLEGMKLESLTIAGTAVSDLSPLKGMPLKELGADFCWTLSDLSPVKDLPLENLFIGQTKVTDLSPLKGMSLKVLNISNTQITDLSPLKGMNTLGVIGWGVWDRFRLMTPARNSLYAGQMDGAAAFARDVADMLDGIPAFIFFNGVLRAFADTKIPEWKNWGSKGDPRKGARPFMGHSYALCPLFKDYAGAQAYCAERGAHLAVITSRQEMDWVIGQFAMPGMPVRLGGTDKEKEGVWQWVNGEPWGFANWMMGQPDNWQGKEHSVIYALDSTWHDVGLDYRGPFLMEWDQ